MKRYAFPLIIYTLFWLITPVATGQTVPVNWDSLSTTESIPEKLLQGKSLLIFKTAAILETNGIRPDWMAMADVVQPYLQRCGIDAVATYHYDDIVSGKETEEAFLFRFKNRMITHLVLVEQTRSGFEIRVAKFDKITLIDTTTPVWYTSAVELKEAANKLFLATSQSGQKFSNRLVLAVPEKGLLVKPIQGRRSEFYDLNLQSDQLAIVPFADTSRIRNVMESYPYKYDFVSGDTPERELRSDGFQFILYYVHSTGEAVRTMLEYPVNDEEDAYVSESFNGETPVAYTYDKNKTVYKFYIKHIYSGNIFLGKKYDAAPSWEEALNLYIANMREQLQ